MKRAFDLVVSCLALIVLAPLYAALALAVRAEGRGPILYVGRRVGANGREFGIFKFRTMVVGADRQGPGITHAADARVTDIGRFLRRTKLDELPQLLNVIRGEMSLVGPRPEAPQYVQLYTAAQRRVLSVRPGITSVASIRYKDEESELTGPEWERTYTESVMPHKLALELAYLENQSLWTDIMLILRTVWPSTKKAHVLGEGSTDAQ